VERAASVADRFTSLRGRAGAVSTAVPALGVDVAIAVFC